MKILSVEILDHEASARLRRDARRTGRAYTKYMVTHSLVTVLNSEISEIRATINPVHNFGSMASPLPSVTSHLVGKYEDHDDVALLFFAREQCRPVLVQFSCEPSKAGVGRLRQAAKSRKFTLRFFRLEGRWVIVEVHSPVNPAEFDANFLKGIGAQW